MPWSLIFALLLLVVVVLRYLRPWGSRCPQCGARRTADMVLCPECGWIYSVPGDDAEEDDWDVEADWSPGEDEE